MVRLTVDFWAIDIRAELSWLQAYLEVLEAQLADLHLHPPQAIKQELDDPDEDVWRPAQQSWHHLTESIAPRLSRGAFVVTLYAMYESAVIELAQAVRTRRVDEQLSLADIAGTSFLDRAKKYFGNVLGIPLCTDPGHWSTLNELALVRHMFAHANGRTGGLSKRSLGVLRALKERGEASEVWDTVVVLQPYSRRALEAVDAALRDLIERTKTPRLTAPIAGHG